MYTAIIVEPRKHKALEYVLQNACECLSHEWNIIVFHGDMNAEYTYAIVNKLNKTHTNRIQAINIHIGNLTQMEYCDLLATKSVLYDSINTELFLVFQTDSLILKANADILHNFLNYDYVGAPWRKTNYIPTKNCDFIGNGGFSLRRKRKMLEIIEKTDWHSLPNDPTKVEDLYFSTNYPGISVHKPTYEQACTFCIDEVYSETAFACHKPWTIPHQYEVLKNKYPEVETLRLLQDSE